MRKLILLSLLLILTASLAVGLNNSNDPSILIKADVCAVTKNADPPVRVKAAEILIYRNKTYKIAPGSKKIESAILTALKKDNLKLNCEQKQGDLTMMYCKNVRCTDSDYGLALLNEIADQLNQAGGDVFYCVGPKD